MGVKARISRMKASPKKSTDKLLKLITPRLLLWQVVKAVRKNQGQSQAKLLPIKIKRRKTSNLSQKQGF